MQPQRLGDLGADGADRVQRGHRVLVDQPDAAAPDLADVRLAQRQQLPALQLDRAGDPGRAGQQPQQRQAGHALARARLAHDRDRLAPLDRETDPVHRVHRRVLGGEPHAQVGDRQGGAHGRPAKSFRWTTPSFITNRTFSIAPMSAAGSPADHDDVGDPADLQRPDLRVQAEVVGRGLRRRDDRGHRLQPVLDHQPHLGGHQVVRVERRARVGAGRDLHARPHRRAEALPVVAGLALGLLHDPVRDAPGAAVVHDPVHRDQGRHQHRAVVDGQLEGLVVQVEAVLDGVDAGPDGVLDAAVADGVAGRPACPRCAPRGPPAPARPAAARSGSGPRRGSARRRWPWP